MMMKKMVLIVALFSSVVCNSCSNNQSKKCYYTLDELLVLDSPKAIIKLRNDSIIEVHDQILDSAQYGMYVFDNQERLRLYAYYTSKDHYRYSEEFDSSGNIIFKEGSQLLKYSLWKKTNDTILFNAFIFALNKKLNNIEITSNFNDTVRPDYLFKSDFNTNVKCFAFKLPVLQKINRLKLYYKGTFINSCSNQKELYYDTTIFCEVKL